MCSLMMLKLSVLLTETHPIFFLPQDIEEFSFVTQLAGITDHLSVAARLAVSTGEEEP
jgi:hypothetical protein